MNVKFITHESGKLRRFIAPVAGAYAFADVETPIETVCVGILLPLEAHELPTEHLERLAESAALKLVADAA